MLKRMLPILLLAVVACSGNAQAKSFHYPRIEIVAELRTDGSMHVTEARQFDFRGNFHEAWRKIPMSQGESITNVTVSEDGKPYRRASGDQPGTYRIEETDREFAIYWFYDISDRVVTFNLTYDVLGAVEKHADLAQLYWQFIEPDRGVEVESAKVTVVLPPEVSKDSVRAYAHGPLWGEVTVEQGRVVFTCEPLRDGEMLEARVLFPTAAIKSSPRQYWDTLEPQVLQEESQRAEQANEERVRSQGELSKARADLRRWSTLVAAMIFLAIISWFILYFGYGREYHDDNPPEYLREPPADWKPNEVAYVWRWGQLTPGDMTATLMDLVRRGALRLIVKTERHERLGGLLGEKVEQEYEIERAPDKEQELSESERYLVNHILFAKAKDNIIAMEEFAKEAREHPTTSQQHYKQWKKLAEKEAKQLNVVDPRSKAALGVGIVLGFIMFFASVMLGGATNSPVFFASAAAGFIMIPASFAILRRTPEAARELQRWQAFRRYLTDFSRLKEYPAPAVALWEKYLVYAITLGVADKVIEQFKELYPQIADQAGSAFPHWVMSGGTPLRGMQSIGNVLSSFNSTMATATSSFSSSSGHGGGFSGGGGGGGGGGSSGAR